MPVIDARQYKTLLICPSKPVAAELRLTLAQSLPRAVMQHIDAYPDREQLAGLIRTFQPAVCFLEISPSKQQTSDIMVALQTVLPGVPITAVLGGNDPDVILHCLRQGASDFLIQPFTPDQIDSCVEKLARILPSADAGPTQAKIISVFPAKGAAGATTIACNLAYQCKRLGLKRILLADMDPLTGTVSFVLNLKSTYSFVDVLQRAASLDADLWKQMVTTSSGIDVLLPPETPLDPIADLPSAAAIIDYARITYDAVILDCGGAYGNWNLSLARLADEVLLVTTTELASVQAAQRVISYFEDNRVETSKIKVVVNRHMKDVGFTLDSLSKVFHGDVFHTIPNEVETVQKSLMEGKAIPGSSPLGKTLATLAQSLVSLKEAEAVKPVAKSPAKSAGKSGLLSSIFGR